MAAVVFERRFIEKRRVQKSRVHDYLYDPAFVVSGARDFARSAFRSAMESAQVQVLPIFETMFSDLKNFPRTQVAMHPNPRLPDHVARSFADIEHNKMAANTQPVPQITGADRYKFFAVPKPLVVLPKVEPVLESLPALSTHHSTPVSRGVQTKYRESSAQTRPWQPKAVVDEDCKETPEVMYLDKLIWGPGYYRTGDLPADFHTTEIINRMRHKRAWMTRLAAAEKDGTIKPESKEYIIRQVETHDWLFREAEIDELQRLRMGLMHDALSQHRAARVSRVEGKLRRLWSERREVLRDKLQKIQRHKDRELRKLKTARTAVTRRYDKCDLLESLTDPASHEWAPFTRHGEHPRRRGHEDIQLSVTPGFLPKYQEPLQMPTIPSEVTESTRPSLYAPKQRKAQLCPRQYRTTDQDLLNLQESLRRTRTATSAPPRCLSRRAPAPALRPSTPTQDTVDDQDEAQYQAALVLQRAVRGRAVQTLMYEGRNRDRELIEHLKAKEKMDKQVDHHHQHQHSESPSRCVEGQQETQDDNSLSPEAQQGAAVSSGLNFLETELRRLKEERKEHAAILIALRERSMREASEAGRRQKEERRRREHDQVFRQVLGLTQVSIDTYLEETIMSGIEDAAETEAVRHATDMADDLELNERRVEVSCELIDQLVHSSDKTEVTREVEEGLIKKGQSERMKRAWDVIFADHRTKTAEEILDTIIYEAVDLTPCCDVDNGDVNEEGPEESQDGLAECSQYKFDTAANDEKPVTEPKNIETPLEINESEELFCTSETCLDQEPSDLNQYANKCKCDKEDFDQTQIPEN